MNLSEGNVNKNARAVTLKGTLAEIARARQLLIGKGLHPQVTEKKQLPFSSTLLPPPPLNSKKIRRV